MNKETKQIDANNSNADLTPDRESVNVLFGLSPKQIYMDVFGYYFDISRMNSVAIMEIYKLIDYKRGEGYEDFLEEELPAIISAIVKLEETATIYDHYSTRHPKSKEIYDISYYEKDDKEAHAMHSKLMDIINIIESYDVKGIHRFICFISLICTSVENRQALEDMLTAFGCVVSIYIAYTSNLLENKVKQLNKF